MITDVKIQFIGSFFKKDFIFLIVVFACQAITIKDIDNTWCKFYQHFSIGEFIFPSKENINHNQDFVRRNCFLCQCGKGQLTPSMTCRGRGTINYYLNKLFALFIYKKNYLIK